MPEHLNYVLCSKRHVILIASLLLESDLHRARVRRDPSRDSDSVVVKNLVWLCANGLWLESESRHYEFSGISCFFSCNINEITLKRRKTTQLTSIFAAHRRKRYDKSPYTHRKIKKATWQHKNTTNKFDYTTIADRLRTVSWSNSSHPTGVVKVVYERSTFPLIATAV